MAGPPREFTARDLTEALQALGRFGSTGAGVTRLAYDDAWCDAHAWLRGEAQRLGLTATADWAGNLFFHDPAVSPGRRAVLIGSHLDSVVNGGRFDGAYGAVAGLMVAAALRGRAGTPVVGFVTAEEEDSRFHGGMMGARSLLGRVEARELEEVRDAADLTWAAVLREARARGCAAPLEGGGPMPAPRFAAEAMVELHIEQGPVLEAEGKALAVVTHVAGYERWKMLLEGEARHSGTTPMAHRRDALVGAAELISSAAVLAGEAGGDAVATSGRLVVEPGLFNVVPGRCEVWLEVRHADPARLAALAVELRTRAEAIAARRGLRLVAERVSRQEPQPLSAELAAEAQRVARRLGIACRTMASGAAHDAMVFARAGVPSVMLFVPSRGGVSHSPDEFTAEAELATGHRAALELCSVLAARGAT